MMFYKMSYIFKAIVLGLIEGCLPKYGLQLMATFLYPLRFYFSPRMVVFFESPPSPRLVLVLLFSSNTDL